MMQAEQGERACRVLVCAVALAMLFALLGPDGARAGGVDAQRFSPSIHAFGLFRTESAKVTRDILPSFVLVFDHASDFFAFRQTSANTRDEELRAFEDRSEVPDPSQPGNILVRDLPNSNRAHIDYLGTMNLTGAIAVAGHLSFGFDLPLHLYRSGGDPVPGTTKLAGATVGDLRLSAKAAILAPHRRGLGVAMAMDIGVPTGSNHGFTDESKAWLEPKLLFEGRSGAIRMLYNLSYRRRLKDFGLKGNDRFQNELRSGFGMGILPPGLNDSLEIPLEAAYITSLDRPFDPALTYLELTGGFRYHHRTGWMIGAAGGGAVLQGYGEPNFRILFTVGYQPQRYVIEDADHDGILDDVDACPRDPEDMDGFQDTDGCPDLDNDGDGVLDANDKCPNKPEDKDGVEDDDGCPDGDRDGDGLDDAIDKCPDDPEDIDHFEDADGCPELDNDNDKIPDTTDHCPNDPEDLDGIEDGDGCPETDADHDGIPDTSDKCPIEAENVNGCEDADGCPESKRVCVTDKKIVIADKIFFSINRAKILRRSNSLVEEIAQVILNHPEIELIEIGGHTDSKGSARYNRKLSARRAAAVEKRLYSLGVPRSRVVARGYGEDQPIADNSTQEGRAKNRRVEFIILKQHQER